MTSSTQFLHLHSHFGLEQVAIHSGRINASHGSIDNRSILEFHRDLLTIQFGEEL
jgi:hypothetical protein